MKKVFLFLVFIPWLYPYAALGGLDGANWTPEYGGSDGGGGKLLLKILFLMFLGGLTLYFGVPFFLNKLNKYKSTTLPKLKKINNQFNRRTPVPKKVDKSELIKKYWPNGILMSEGYLRNGLREGNWVGYWKSGKLWYQGRYKKFRKEGNWVFFHENGKIDKMKTGFYKRGIRVSKRKRH